MKTHTGVKGSKSIKPQTLDTNQYQIWEGTANQIFQVFDVVEGSAPTSTSVDTQQAQTNTGLELTDQGKRSNDRNNNPNNDGKQIGHHIGKRLKRNGIDLEVSSELLRSNNFHQRNQRNQRSTENIPRWHPNAAMTIAPHVKFDANLWLYDSACNAHIMPQIQRIERLVAFETPLRIVGIAGTATEAFGIGDVRLADQQGHVFTLQKAFYVPAAQKPIISLMAARLDGLFFNFISMLDFEVVAPSTGFRLTGQSVDCMLQVRDYGIVPKPYVFTTHSPTHNIGDGGEDEDRWGSEET
jgi:hypothetical protein